jgi:hypothetical protein
VAKVMEGVAVEKRINRKWSWWTGRLFCVRGEEGWRMMVLTATRSRGRML